MTGPPPKERGDPASATRAPTGTIAANGRYRIDAVPTG